MADPTAPGSIRLSNVILRVSDLGRSIAFYRDSVGLSLRSQTPNFAFLDAGGVSVALNEAPADRAGAGGCLTEVVFDVSDIEAAHQAMQQRGVEFLNEPMVVSSDDSHDLLAAAFRDPDGHLLSLTCRRPRG